MLSVVFSDLVLFVFFLKETYFYHLRVYLLACFYEKHLKFLTSHICFHLDNSELWKQYQSVSQEMMEQVYDLETVQLQEIPIKVEVVIGCGISKKFCLGGLVWNLSFLLWRISAILILQDKK